MIEECIRHAGEVSPLDVLYPTESLRRAYLIGSNCPSWLRVAWLTAEPRDADLVILAPSAAECHIPGWLDRTVQSFVEERHPDSIVYVHVPVAFRSRVLHRLQQAGLLVDFFINLPSWEDTRYLVSLDYAAAKYALSFLIPTRRWKRKLLLGALHLPRGRTLLGWILPGASLIAHPGRARPFLDWVHYLDSEEPRLERAIVSLSLRERQGSIVIHGLSTGTSPANVTKLSWNHEGASRTATEGERLVEQGPSAHRAGARVPDVRVTQQIGDVSVLVESVISGRPAAAILAAHPRRLAPILGQVVDWLIAWNRLTKAERYVGGSEIEQWVRAWVHDISFTLADSSDYLRWISLRCGEITAPVPLVATHNDLTTWNVLVDERDGLGIVDWQEARPDGLPLVDFFYVLVDAVTAARLAVDRLSAFQQCFAPTGVYRELTRQLLARLRQDVDVPIDAIDLCLHVCFLGHAANERKQTTGGRSQPFYDLAHWIILNREVVRQWSRE